MRLKKYLIPAIAIFILIASCKKKDKQVEEEVPVPVPVSPLPTVVTSSIINLTDSSATSGGTVTSAGTSAMLAVGVCWDTLSGPTTLRDHTTEGAGTGSYVSSLTKLRSGKKYFVRAYATNYNGTSYGNEISLTVPAAKIWKQSNLSYSMRCMMNDGASVYVGTTDGIIFSSDSGNTWSVKGLAGSGIADIVKKGNLMFATTTFYDLLKSSDNGATWSSIKNNLSYPSTNILSVSAINDKLMVGTNNSAFYSADDGVTWNKAWTGLTQPASGSFPDGRIYTIKTTEQKMYTFDEDFSSGYYDFKLVSYDPADNSWNSAGYSYFISLMTGGGYSSFAVTKNNVFCSSSTSGYSIKKNDGSAITLPASISDDKKYFYANGGSSVLCISYNSSNIPSFFISNNEGVSWGKMKSIGLPANLYIYSAFVSTGYIWLQTTSGLYQYKL